MTLLAKIQVDSHLCSSEWKSCHHAKEAFKILDRIGSHPKAKGKSTEAKTNFPDDLRIDPCSSKKVLIAAGGTGGHLFPALELAEYFQQDQILFAGHGLSHSPFFEKNRLDFVDITSHPLKKGFFSATCKGFIEAFSLIRSYHPDVVIGFGSYHTFPTLLAAAFLRKKIVLFEANAILGRVNRFFSPFAEKIFVQFPLDHKKAVCVDWRPWGTKGKKKRIDRKEALLHYGLQEGKKTLLIFGGSQGSRFFNEIAPFFLEIYRDKIQVIHFTGSNPEEVLQNYQNLQIDAYVASFESQMEYAYSAADFVLSRSGAATIAELFFYQLPAIFIPYPYATDDHQRKNAEYALDQKVARMVLQKEATIAFLRENLEKLFEEEELMRTCYAKISKEKRLKIEEFLKSL